MPIKTLGSLGKIRVGRVTGNTHFFFWPNLSVCKHRSILKYAGLFVPTEAHNNASMVICGQ